MENFSEVIKELKPALERVKLLKGTMASVVAEQLLGEVDHGFIPEIDEDGMIVISESSGKSPEPWCTWEWGDSGLRIFNGMVEAFTSGKHWVRLDGNGDVIDADIHFRDPECCRFWAYQAKFISA